MLLSSGRGEKVVLRREWRNDIMSGELFIAEPAYDEDEMDEAGDGGRGGGGAYPYEDGG